MYKIKIITSFSAAHFLRNYKGKCENLHGHNWKVEVSLVSAKLNQSGMVMDFSKLKILTNKALTALDHKILNNLAPFKRINPSSEEIAKYLFIKLNQKIRVKDCNLDEVRVWETDNAYASYRE
ncbi:MAG: 6-carboxytetrahydropterin synthase QueD [Candidatus Omnitrophica bacterium]|jgi:6-pyruvoyltetrahydropterin/6-carboxytetrahydropterin synthase|nr:6-carboxytetrahydropterin synthase QueD [Candidatus Omnitrophota bacterium]